ncbi:helix-turn-helix domain-containing protein [Streptomyces sp. NPDC006173]|uniref:helix-turn-helix domain-containing protein n=1 Tax=Streptomyces sp. NPDC006173 TaxID=3155349 RepID=UPI003408C630
MENVLKAAGLSTQETELYRSLVAGVPASPREAAIAAGVDEDTARQLLVSLEEKGLVHGVDGLPAKFAPSAPDVALMPRLERSTEELNKARVALAELMDAYRQHSRATDAVRVVEIITGAGALRQRLQQIQDGARDALLWFCKAQYVAMPSGTNRAEFDALRRGVEYRVLYERAFFDEGGTVDNVVRAVHAGEMARAVPALPLRMVIADQGVAICPLTSTGASDNPRAVSAMVIRESSLLEALTSLFARYWEVGAPLRVTAEGGIGGPGLSTDEASISPKDQHLVSLMIAGITDSSIAGQLGVSRRTVQRRLQVLMNLAGVSTRMQLGWHAARRNWI